jgi:hypothetical protein
MVALHIPRASASDDPVGNRSRANTTGSTLGRELVGQLLASRQTPTRSEFGQSISPHSGF